MRLYIVYNPQGKTLLDTARYGDATYAQDAAVNNAGPYITEWSQLEQLGFSVKTYVPESSFIPVHDAGFSRTWIEPVAQQVPTWQEMLNAWHDNTVIRYPSTLAAQCATYTRDDGSRYTFKLVLDLTNGSDPILAVNPYRVESYDVDMPDAVQTVPTWQEMMAAYESGDPIRYPMTTPSVRPSYLRDGDTCITFGLVRVGFAYTEDSLGDLYAVKTYTTGGIPNDAPAAPVVAKTHEQLQQACINRTSIVWEGLEGDTVEIRTTKHEFPKAAPGVHPRQVHIMDYKLRKVSGSTATYYVESISETLE